VFGWLCLFGCVLGVAGVAHAKDAHRGGVKLGEACKDAFRGASSAKKHGKLAIGMEWALDQLVLRLPAKSEELPAHARMITATMQHKKVMLPAFMMAVLQGMAGADDDADAAPLA
jgi:hypothetical protein